MAYATANDLFDRYDPRQIADYVNDEGVRGSRASLATNTALTTALDDASGQIDAALLAGKRYSTTDLSGLTGNALAFLKQITCDIAMARIFNRRAGTDPKLAEAQRKMAAAHLKKLTDGVNVFNLGPQQDASTPTINGPSAVDYARINTLADRIGGKLVPSRAQRLPTDRN